MGSLNGRDREKAVRGSGTEGGSDPEMASKCSFSRQEKKAKVSRNTGEGHANLHLSNWFVETQQNSFTTRERSFACEARVCVCVCVASKIYGALFAHVYSIQAKGRICITLTVYSWSDQMLLFRLCKFTVKHENLADPIWPESFLEN